MRMRYIYTALITTAIILSSAAAQAGYLWNE
jgi:hypothetical protein